mmetsp:Transcript_37242/g.41969  ORF Transcript_37242/g.41969 Transcript_37242/m.41969 type:complete len:631 (-) Transcript_37242:106-1998(-)
MMMMSRNSNSGSGVLVILFVALLLACCSTNNNSKNSAALFVVAVSCNSTTTDGVVAPCVDIIGGDTSDSAGASFTGKALTTEAGVAVDAFLGIQYATQARFEPSVVKLITTPEDEDATVLGPSCPQLASVWSDASDTDDDEECLYLNIWRPSSTTETDQDAANTTTTLLPVMVWIHGGAFIFGSGNNPNFDGANLAGNEQVIVITINYRLNVFGYMPFENDDSASGSSGGMNGILDQIRALEWIQSRIADFGGDPEQVTIFGESAGAISVCQLSVIPEAKGLFLRGIMESGSCRFLATVTYDKTMVDQAIATALPGCNAEEGGTVCGLDDLKKFSVQELLNITVAHDFFKPVWDPAVISTPNPAELYADSTNINPIDMIIGSNTKDDYNLVFYTEKNAYLENHSGFENSPELSLASPQVKGRIVELYADEKYGDSSVSAYAEFVGDFAFGCSSRLIATTAASSLKKGNVYFYSFGRLSPFDIAYANGLLQGPPKNIQSDTSWASHEGEIPFVFGNPTQLPNLDPVIEEIPLDFDRAEQVLVKEIQSRWATFAKSGVATATTDDDDYDVWSMVSPESVAGSLDPAYMSFGDTGGVMVSTDDNKNEQCTAMLDVYASLGGAPEGEETEESEL